MTRGVALLLLAGAGSAAAQPVTHPEVEACKVTVAFAPDDVRAEIEAWVRAEPRCERELVVRVTPTEEGLYLTAVDLEGHVRERVIPDAQSAAVLVVSWMADDSIGPTPTERADAEPVPVAAPGTRAPMEVRDDELPGGIQFTGLRARAAGDPAHRWLSFGALAGDGGGARAQIDLFARGRWSLGLAGSWHRDERRGADDERSAARVVFGATQTFGRWAVRAQVGVGVERNAQVGDRMADGVGDVMRAPEVAPTVELGLYARVRVRGAWGVVGGPVLEATRGTEHPNVNVFLGVQRGL